jgi:hypothetical protein
MPTRTSGGDAEPGLRRLSSRMENVKPMTDLREPPPQTDMGCLSILLFALGAILLFPGICAALFMAGAAFGRETFFKFNDPVLILLWLICFAISLGGAALIRHVSRGTRKRGP